MRYRTFAIILALGAFALSGCAPGGALVVPDRDFQREADVACRAIGGTLAALAPYRADMPAKVEASVEAVRVQSAPLCSGDNPPRTVDIAQDLQRMAISLLAVERESVK